MKQHHIRESWFGQKKWQMSLVVLAVILILIFPVGLTLAEETSPPETSRSIDGFSYPSQEDNLDLTRGMMYMGGLMVLIVVVSTLRILQLDRVNRPHLLQPRKKRELPDATIKKPDENNQIAEDSKESVDDQHKKDG